MPNEFRRWVASAPDGSASSNDLVKFVSKLPGGNIQVLSFNLGVLVGKKVIDETGNVLEDGRKALGDPAGSVKRAGGRLERWIKNRSGLRF